MVKKRISSRDRMLQALNLEESNYIPCSFMIFSALQQKCKDQFEFINRQLKLGLDARAELPELPFRYHPQVKIKEWKEGSFLYKEYATPAGSLTSIVKKTGDWSYGDHIPLFNDYLAPSSQKFPVTKEEDLESLKYLFAEPTREDILSFRGQAKKIKNFAWQKKLLVCGGWRNKGPEKGIDKDGGVMGADALMWLCGMERALLWAMDKPEIIQRLLQIIADWNKKRIEIYLEEGIDLLIRRAWYESTDLWSPSLYRKFMFPILKEEIELTHQAGTKFGYIMTSGVMPLLDDFLKLEIDVIIGVDPTQGKGTDLKLLKQKIGKKICLWGGINGCLTVERGSKEEIISSVEEAIGFLSHGGGFILSPVDNIQNSSSRVWNNVKILLTAWEKRQKVI